MGRKDAGNYAKVKKRSIPKQEPLVVISLEEGNNLQRGKRRYNESGRGQSALAYLTE